MNQVPADELAEALYLDADEAARVKLYIDIVATKGGDGLVTKTIKCVHCDDEEDAMIFGGHAVVLSDGTVLDVRSESCAKDACPAARVIVQYLKFVASADGHLNDL
jgi:hypothetical protein